MSALCMLQYWTEMHLLQQWYPTPDRSESEEGRTGELLWISSRLSGNRCSKQIWRFSWAMHRAASEVGAFPQQTCRKNLQRKETNASRKYHWEEASDQGILFWQDPDVGQTHQWCVQVTWSAVVQVCTFLHVEWTDRPRFLCKPLDRPGKTWHRRSLRSSCSWAVKTPRYYRRKPVETKQSAVGVDGKQVLRVVVHLVHVSLRSIMLKYLQPLSWLKTSSGTGSG